MNASYQIIIENYTQYLQTLGFSDSTCYNYPRFVARFLEYAEQKAICEIDRISTKTVWNYYTHLEQATGERTGQPLSTSHLNSIFLAIDKFLEFLHQMGLHTAPSPLCYTVEHTRKKPLWVLTRREVQSLYDAVPLTFEKMTFATRQPRQQSLQLILDLCYGCGLRRSEAANLKTGDIDFDRKVVHIRQGKNYKDRFVPMSGQVCENLKIFVYQYRRQFSQRAGYLYPYDKGSMGTRLNILTEQSDSETLKAKNPTPHTLRHSIATHLLHNGMNIEHIARFLGHSTLESTQIYTHIVNEYGDELQSNHEH